MEILDIVDEYGNPTGNVIDREIAHSEGIMHRTSHVWIIRRHIDKIEILLQKRSADKDSHPNCYDISSAGHIPAGFDFKQSAVRELMEELGVDATEDELVYCGDRIIIWDDEFYGKPFHDRQYSRVFYIARDMSEDEFTIQEAELSAVRWMELDECINAVRHNLIKHCICLDELEMVKKSINI